MRSSSLNPRRAIGSTPRRGQRSPTLACACARWVVVVRRSRCCSKRSASAPITAVFELADLQLELGSPGVAGQVVERYLALGLMAPDVLLMGVRAAMAREERQAALALARRLKREFPDSSEMRQVASLLGEGVQP